MLVAALYGEPRHVIMVLAASFPVTFFLADAAPAPRARVLGDRGRRSSASSGSAWRWRTRSGCASLPHGDGLVIDVLVATFVGDTAAYFGGRFYGRTPLAPLISPNKTLEGLVARRAWAARSRSGSPGSTRTG